MTTHQTVRARREVPPTASLGSLPVSPTLLCLKGDHTPSSKSRAHLSLTEQCSRLRTNPGLLRLRDPQCPRRPPPTLLHLLVSTASDLDSSLSSTSTSRPETLHPIMLSAVPEDHLDFSVLWNILLTFSCSVSLQPLHQAL